MTAPGYPAGPFGPQIGDTIPNFTFAGYYRPNKSSGIATEATFGQLSFDQIRQSGAKYALISLSAAWCIGCFLNDKTLTASVAPIIDAGGFIMGILTEGRTSSVAATKADLDTWIQSLSAPYTWTLDSVYPQPRVQSFFDGVFIPNGGVSRGNFVTVDLSTMKIVGLFGDSFSLALNPQKAALDQLSELLHLPPPDMANVD
jgi:hypothetical protein